MKKLVAFSGLAMATSLAAAVEQPYIGVDYLSAQYDKSATTGGGASFSASPGAARLRMGSDLGKYIGGEAHVIVGTSDDEATVAGVNYAIQLDSMYTVGVTARMPLGGGRIYGFAGYSYLQTSADTSAAAASSSETNDDGFSYGLGAAFPIGSTWQFEIDYMAYVDKEAYSLTGLGIGFRRPL